MRWSASWFALASVVCACANDAVAKSEWPSNVFAHGVHAPLVIDQPFRNIAKTSSGLHQPLHMAWRMAVLGDQPQLSVWVMRPLGTQRHAWDPQWHLGIAANALVQPGERRVIAGLSRTQRHARVTAGLEAMEADLLPAAEQPNLGNRRVRRSGLLLAWHLHSHSGSQQFLPFGMRPTGISVRGALRLWQSPSVNERPVLDSQLRLTLGTRLVGPRVRRQVWADVAWRGLVGSDDRLLALGGWPMPQHLGSRGGRVFNEAVVGYEDTLRYTARTLQGQAGAAASIGRSARLDVFAAATQMDALAQSPGRWLRSIGARLSLGGGRGDGLRPSLSYQLARRFDGSRGPWLHMLTASI